MKILLVSEKPAHVREFLHVIKQHPTEFPDEYFIDYVKAIRHLNDSCCGFKKIDDVYYSHGSPCSIKPLSLKSLSIPIDTYMESQSDTSRYNYKSVTYPNAYDKIISICENDEYGKLAFAKYLEDHNIDFAEPSFIDWFCLTPGIISKKLKEANTPFNEVFEELKDKLNHDNYFSPY